MPLFHVLKGQILLYCTIGVTFGTTDKRGTVGVALAQQEIRLDDVHACNKTIDFPAYTGFTWGLIKHEIIGFLSEQRVPRDRGYTNAYLRAPFHLFTRCDKSMVIVVFSLPTVGCFEKSYS